MPIVHYLLIIVTGLLAYSNTFHVPFTFDDISNIVDNPIIKDLKYFLDPSAAKRFELYSALNSRFVGYLSFAFNYRLHGLDVTGYHIFNLAVHIINALLVFWLVRLTFRTPYFAKQNNEATRNNGLIALFSALLFVAHPIQTQAVTYIVQRLASLATLFYILSFTTYIRARHSLTEVGNPLSVKFIAFFFLSLVSAVLAMKTKEIAFTLPIMIALYEAMFLTGKIWRRVLCLTPLFLTMLIIPLSFLHLDTPLANMLADASRVTKVQTAMSRWDYLFTQFRVIVTYVRLLFLPINQQVDYDYPVYRYFFDPEVLLSFIALLSIFALALYLTYRSQSGNYQLRLVAFGIFWFFITLAIESSLIPIVDVIFEHRLYLPLIGASITIISTAYIVASSFNYKMRTLIIVLSILISSFAVTTYYRNNLWIDEITLWRDNLRKSPKKARVLIGLGFAYEKKGMFDTAIYLYNNALIYSPDYAFAYHHTANLYSRIGQLGKAIEYHTMALKIDPTLYTAYYNRGNVYRLQGKFDAAIKDYTIAISLNQNFPEAYNNRGSIYILEDKIDAAINDFSMAISINSGYAEAYNNRGIAYLSKGSNDMAIADFNKAKELSFIEN